MARKVYRSKPMQRRTAAKSRGFTLVELLVVIAMVGILAALAIVGFRRYVTSAGTAEPKGMFLHFRLGEKLYHDDTMQYLGCAGCGANGCAPGGGSLTAYYPVATPDSKKRSWDQGNAEFDCWKKLNAPTDAAVRFGYSIVAGGAGDAVKQGVGFTNILPFPQPDTDWYVMQAAGDRNENGAQALLISTSWSDEIYFENDSE